MLHADLYSCARMCRQYLVFAIALFMRLLLFIALCVALVRGVLAVSGLFGAQQSPRSL